MSLLAFFDRNPAGKDSPRASGSLVCLSFGDGGHKITLLSASLKKEADEKLFLELARHGDDLSKLRDEPTTAEIIKIG